MKISARLNSLSLVSTLVMTVGALLAAGWYFETTQRASYEQLLALELENATMAVQRRLERSGVLAARQEAQRQDARLRATEGFRTAELLVLEELDRRVVHHRARAFDTHYARPFVEAMLRASHGELSYDDQGVRRMAAFRTLEPMGWLVVVSVARDEVFASLRYFTLTIAALTLAALGVNAALYRFASRRAI